MSEVCAVDNNGEVDKNGDSNIKKPIKRKRRQTFSRRKRRKTNIKSQLNITDAENSMSGDVKNKGEDVIVSNSQGTEIKDSAPESAVFIENENNEDNTVIDRRNMKSIVDNSSNDLQNGDQPSIDKTDEIVAKCPNTG